METDREQDRAVYCIIATFLPQAAADGTRELAFESGAKVYCFPPNVAGAYESVRAIGPAPRNGKLCSALVAAHDLTGWRAEAVRDRDVLRHISPPWDASHVSRDVARGVAKWKSGGDFPSAEIRDWNRAHAHTQVGPDTLFGRVRGLIGKALGRD